MRLSRGGSICKACHAGYYDIVGCEQCTIDLALQRRAEISINNMSREALERPLTSTERSRLHRANRTFDTSREPIEDHYKPHRLQGQPNWSFLLTSWTLLGFILGFAYLIDVFGKLLNGVK